MNIIARFIIFILPLFAVSPLCKAEEVTTASDSDNVVDSLAPESKTSWIGQLIDNGFHINDPAIRYPKFARFCLKLYNWGDRTFNSYDSDYVVSTGKNWKLFAQNDTWMESYALLFRDRSYVRIQSQLYDDLGANISFMAVSLGYTVNARTLFQHTRESRSRFSFNFVCALFAANLYWSSNDGGAKITHFGKYEPIRKHHLDFQDVHSKSFSVNGFYIFNHRKYSHAAAYCYSKYQLKNAGSWLLGVAYNNQNIDMDFNGLPQEMLEYIPIEQRKFVFDYREIALMGGYGYSWALKPRIWLLNLSVLPSIGYRHSYEDATDSRKDMVSANFRMMFSAVYNHKALYAALNGNVIAHFYFGDRYTFANTSELLHFTVGMRF